MKKIKIYGYKGCSTCKKANGYLDKKGVEFEEIDITAKGELYLLEANRETLAAATSIPFITYLWLWPLIVFVIGVVMGHAGEHDYRRGRDRDDDDRFEQWRGKGKKKGWVHGDVRPANIFLGEDGRVRLAGLGQKRATSAESMPPLKPSTADLKPHFTK